MSATTRFPQGPVVDASTLTVTLEWQQWLQNPEFVTVQVDNPISVASGGTGSSTALESQLQMAGPLYPATELGAAQNVVSLYAGNGVPNNAGGMNGDFYFRADGSVGSNLYKKSAGLWAAIL